MKVQLLVTLTVEDCDSDEFKGTEEQFKVAALDGVRNALYEAQGDGFNHERSDDISILVDEVVVA